MRLSPKLSLPLAVAGGAILPLAYAPFDQVWIAPLSFSALMYVWHGTVPARAFRLGFAFGLASFFGGVSWVYVSIHDFGPAHFALAGSITFALIIFLSLYVALTGWITARWFSLEGPGAWLGSIPALWVLTEWSRGWVLSGFGWLAAGYSQTDSWLMGYAPVGGVYLMSWAVLATGGALLTLVLGSKRARLAAMALVAVIWTGGFLLSGVRWTVPKPDLVTVSLVQGAVPQELKWLPGQYQPTLDLYRDLTYESEGSALIIWPEAAIPALYSRAADFLAEIETWADERESEVLLGILRADPNGDAVQNTLLALGEPRAFYTKRHLVPYGEYFPVPNFVRDWLRLMSLPYSDAAPGVAGQPPIDAAGERLAVTICYEDLFGSEQLHYFPEATLLVNISNDAWFGDSVAPHQHLQIARVRSAEARRYTLRTTNTGISGIIDPYGRIVARSPQFEPHVLRGAVQGFTGTTPYARWGNYGVVGAALLVLLLQLLTTKFTMRPWT